MNIAVWGVIQAVKHRLSFGRALIYESLAHCASVLFQAVGFWAILSRFNAIGGWTPLEVFLLFGVGGVVQGIGSRFFWRGMEATGMLVKDGFFDVYLTKPTNHYWGLVAGNINPSTFPSLLLFLVGIIGGMLILAAFNTLCGVLRFRAVRGEYSIRLVSRVESITAYPMHIYPKALQITLTWILPFALTNYFPTRYLIHGDVPLGGWLMLLTLAIGEILFVAAYRLWNAGLAHYQSTGN